MEKVEEHMSDTRKKSVNIVYNGVEVKKTLDPYIERFSYTDAVDQSDKISLSVSDRDLKWVNSWIPEKGDVILPSIITENWNYEGEKTTIVCGEFVVDDFSFTAPPIKGSINGVSAPVNSSFKESENTKTWEAATVQLVASEIAGKYGLTLRYEASGDIQIAKMEQDKQTDSDFLKKLCEKYGLGLKVYARRLVIWDYKQYYAAAPVLTLTPDMVSKWAYKSTLQGTYTGARVSYTDPNTKKTVDVLVGTMERLYKTTQKADSEADAQIIGESAILQANRKETTMQISLPPRLSLMATKTVLISGFGKMDGMYFVESVSHTISRKSYDMQVSLSCIPKARTEMADAGEEGAAGASYVIQKGDTLWDIAKERLGDASKCAELYQANQTAIEEDAKRHGKRDSNNGYWIWSGLTLVIPGRRIYE